jgi:aspartate racemase
VILACTELPVALDAIASPLRAHCIDSTAALARACVRTWRESIAAGAIANL